MVNLYFNQKIFLRTFCILATLCAEGSLKHIYVKGIIVLWDTGGISRIEKGKTVKDAGGAAMIVTNREVEGASMFAEAHVLPASHIGHREGILIKKYIDASSKPVATIVFRGTTIGINTAPEVTYFSSRGPSRASPGIVKPDIIGPGVNILAAWSTSVENTTRTKATFNIVSGTSMSRPHVAGISTLLKNKHPDLSPAAIKSAIMTTADRLNLNGQPTEDESEVPADIFATGSGHVNPSKASNPGLIFDIKPDDYIPYLCGLGYTRKQVGLIVQNKVTCLESIEEAELNYPSITVTLRAGEENYSQGQ